MLQEYGQAVQNKWSDSLVCIAVCKSDSFSVRDGLCQGCSLSPILFITSMDKISRNSQGAEGFRFSGVRISSPLFVDDAVLLAPSGGDLQLSLGAVQS